MGSATKARDRAFRLSIAAGSAAETWRAENQSLSMVSEGAVPSTSPKRAESTAAR